MRYPSTLLTALLLVDGLTDMASSEPFAQGCVEPVDVSLVALVATPERFEGRCVRTIGFLHLEFEGNGLYIHRDDYRRGIHKNGVWVNVHGRPGVPHPANNDYVIVEGMFDARNHGHMGLWSGAIDDIARLEPWYRVDVDSMGNVHIDSTAD